MKWSKYNYNWISGESVHIYNSVHNLLAIMDRDEYCHMSDELRGSLEEKGFVVRKNNNESEIAIMNINQKFISNEEFSCWIFLTNKCNLACSYCFEKDSLLIKPDMDMNEMTANKTVEWIIQKADEKKVKNINITFTGGEPLLNIETMKFMADKILQKKYRVNFHVITNGVLLDERTITNLKESNIISYQITLDGPPQIHNARRIFHNGSGSFELIINNIIKAIRRDESLEFTIRINIDNDNKGQVHKLLSILKKLDLEHYIALCVNDTIYDNCSDKSVDLTEIITILADAKKLGFKIIFGELNNCWIMSDMWYMVDTDGSLYKCPSFVGREDYKVGHINGYFNTTIYNSQTEIKPWEDCLDCELVGLCAGGCPYRNLLKKGTLDGGKVCRKTYMSQLIKLKYED